MFRFGSPTADGGLMREWWGGSTRAVSLIWSRFNAQHHLLGFLEDDLRLLVGVDVRGDRDRDKIRTPSRGKAGAAAPVTSPFLKLWWMRRKNRSSGSTRGGDVRTRPFL